MGDFLNSIWSFFAQMDLWGWLEAVATLGCAVYVVMQARQMKLMWYVDLVAVIAAFVLYIHARLWGSAALNFYYIVMAVVGIWQWGKAGKKSGDGVIRLRRMDRRTVLVSLAIALLGTPLLYLLLSHTGDPSPLLDSIVFDGSIIATWWLTRLHIHQWVLWVAVDSVGVVLNFSEGLYGMALLYCFCITMAVFGFFNWRRKGQYL